MPCGRLSIGRDLGATAHQDVAFGGSDGDPGQRARCRVGVGLDDAVEIDRDGVGITRGLNFRSSSLDGSGMMDGSRGGCLRLYQEAFVGIWLVEDFVTCGQTDHPLAGGERPLVVDRAGNEGNISCLGVDGAEILDGGFAGSLEVEGPTLEELVVGDVVGRSDEGIHVDHAGLGDGDAGGIDKDHAAIGLQPSLDHAAGAPVDTVQRHARAAWLDKAGRLPLPDGEGVPPHDQQIRSLMDRQCFPILVDRGAAMAHRATCGVGPECAQIQGEHHNGNDPTPRISTPAAVDGRKDLPGRDRRAKNHNFTT